MSDPHARARSMIPRRHFIGGMASMGTGLLPAAARAENSLTAAIVGACPTTRVEPKGPLLLIAHHGATRVYPENTIESCAWALNVEKATALEVDLCMSKDGEVFLWHDWDPDGLISVSRQLGLQPNTLYGPAVPERGSATRRPVDTLTLAEIRASCGYKKFDRSYDTAPAPAMARDPRLPSLLEFMDWARAQPELRCVCLDIKMPPASVARAAEMLDGVQRAISAGENKFAVVIMVPDEPVLQAMLARDAQMSYGLRFTWDIELPPVFVRDPVAHSAIDHASAYHLRAASVGKSNPATVLPWRSYSEVLEHDLTAWKGRRGAVDGVETLIAWTINDPGELDCLVRSGVTGIITDDIPTLRRTALAAKRET